MKKYTIMFSQHDRGWEMIPLPSALQDKAYDELIDWAAGQAKLKNLKGFLVSENPSPFPMRKD
jgi:hypothetical protein